MNLSENAAATEQALGFLQQGNQFAAQGQWDRAQESFSNGLIRLPNSSGLLLNRSIAYQYLQNTKAALEDLERYFDHAGSADQEQNWIALKHYVALSLELNKQSAVLHRLQSLELLPAYHCADFYDVLIRFFVISPELNEDLLQHYLERAAKCHGLTKATLENALNVWRLHGLSFQHADNQRQAGEIATILAPLALTPESPQFVLFLWLDELNNLGLSEEDKSTQAINILSLWMHAHQMDRVAADLLIEYLLGTNQVDVAESIFLSLSQRYPKEYFYLLSLARIRGFKQDAENAFIIINAALDLDEKNLEIRLERAKVFSRLGSPSLALVDLNQNLHLDSKHLGSLMAKVDVLADLGRIDEALTLQAEVAAQDLSDSDRLNMCLAKLMAYRLGGRDREWSEYLDILSNQYPNNPAVAYEMGWKKIYQGDWKSGFALMENRFAPGIHYFALQPHITYARIPQWSPEIFTKSLEGKHLLLCGEEGLGDVIQFARFIPLFLSKGLQITLVCKEPLHDLLAFNFPQVRILSPKVLIEELRNPDTHSYDFYGEMMSAPYVLSLDKQDISDAPYLKAIPDRVTYWKNHLPFTSNQKQDVFSIGLRWLSNMERASRSIPLEVFSELSSWPISMVGLHHGPIKSSDKNCYEGWPNFYPTELEIADIAALMMHLDCIVTCDTVTAHLAGALGRPTILLKPIYINWRWGSVGTQSIWYRTMHIIRQDKILNWEGAIKALKTELNLRMTKKPFF